jgi:hypothetical protein
MSIVNLEAPNSLELNCGKLTTGSISYNNSLTFNFSHLQNGTTPTVALTIQTALNTNYNIILNLQCRVTSSPNTGNGKAICYTASFRNVDGVVAQIGSQTTVYSMTDVSAATFNPGFSITGTNVLLTFSGSIGVNTQWNGTYTIITC